MMIRRYYEYFFIFPRNRYPENGCKRYGEITGRNVPNADTFYRRIKEKKKKEILEEFFFYPRKNNIKIQEEKNYHVFCTNIDVTKANLSFLADLYGKRWNVENFYRDADSFMIKTKTIDFTARYFFFLFMSLLYNLWYFVRRFSPVTAEEWKDWIENELKWNNIDALKIIAETIIQLKLFYLSFLSFTGAFSAFIF